MESIDAQAFEFVKRVTKRPQEPKARGPQKEMKGLGQIMDIPMPENYSIGETDPLDHQQVSRFEQVNDGDYGLAEPVYGQFNEVVIGLLAYEPFSTWCDSEFVTNYAFKWLMQTFRQQRAESTLTNYLLDVLEKESKEHEFYFRVLPLQIEEPFGIGDVEVMFFTNDEVTKWTDPIAKHRPVSENELASLKEKFSGVFARVKAKGVSNRALESATRQAGLAIDALKCLFTNEAVADYFLFFDLETRFRPPSIGDVFSLREEPFECVLHLRGTHNRVPLSITRKVLSTGESKGLRMIGRFLTQSPDTELAIEINRCLADFAAILSTPDHYEKIIMSIRLMESVVLPRDAGGKSKGETRVRNVLVPSIIDVPDQKEKILKALRNIYEIRDRYLHNAQRLPTNREHIFYALEFQRLMILTLIAMHPQIQTMDELQDWLRNPSQ